MIVYKLTEGFAHDLCHQSDIYVLLDNERMHAAGFGTLPPLETLHDPLAVKAKRDAEESARELAIKRDAALRVLDEQRLQVAAADPNASQAVKEYAAAQGGSMNF